MLELGCGVGTVLMCVGWRTASALTGVELVPDVAELAQQNSELNGIKADIHEGDVAHLPTTIKVNRFDFVLMNPPYFGPGTISEDIYRDTARRENTPLSIWIDTALKRLAPGGTLILIHTADRLGAILELLEKHAVRTEIKPLAPREAKPATRVILKVKRAKSDSTTLYNPLILHSGSRHTGDTPDFSPQAEAILREGAALKF